MIFLAHVNFITKVLSLSLSYLTLTMARHSCTPTDPGLPPRSSAVFRCYDRLIRVWDATSDLMIRKSDSMEEHHGKPLSQNRIQLVSSRAFKIFPVESVHSQNEKICCIAGPWSCCVVHKDPFSSCHDLLPNTSMKYTSRFVAIFYHYIEFNIIYFSPQSL